MGNPNIETGMQPLHWEFIPASNQNGILSQYQSWQHQTTSAVLFALFKKKYGSSETFNFNSWAKSKTRMIFKFDPLEDFEDPNVGAKDRLRVQKFIADIRALKNETDDIYFSTYSNDTDKEVKIDSVLMSFHIPDILPYLSTLLGGVPESAGILQAIDQVASSYLRAEYKHLPQYNN